MCGCNLTFDPLKIKWSRASEGYYQVIKHTFGWLKSLILVANVSTGGIQVTTPLHYWKVVCRVKILLIVLTWQAVALNFNPNRHIEYVILYENSTVRLASVRFTQACPNISKFPAKLCVPGPLSNIKAAYPTPTFQLMSMPLQNSMFPAC